MSPQLSTKELVVNLVSIIKIALEKIKWQRPGTEGVNEVEPVIG